MNLLAKYQEEKQMNLKGGLYHQTQIRLAYNSNRIEGSKLSEEQTRYIFETNTFYLENGDKTANVDDIVAQHRRRCRVGGMAVDRGDDFPPPVPFPFRFMISPGDRRHGEDRLAAAAGIRGPDHRPVAGSRRPAPIRRRE